MQGTTTLSQMIVAMKQYASELAKVDDITQLSEAELSQATQHYLDASDDVAHDVLTLQSAHEAISELAGRLKEATGQSVTEADELHCQQLQQAISHFDIDLVARWADQLPE